LELQFNKVVLPYLKQIVSEVQDQEQTQELRLPDTMPDIARVLCSRGQILIRNKQWHNDAVSVGGGVMVWVLYQPEDDSGVKWVETWIPFQMRWEIPETKRDGSICVRPLLRSVDARNTSARKLFVRACVSLQSSVGAPDDTEIYTPSELPDDIQLLQKSYSFVLPTEAGEKAFVLDDSISLPAELPQPEKVISYCVQPVILEKKVLTDKLVFRGTANLHMLYMSENGKIHSWDFEMPFSQYTELEKEHVADAVADVCPVLTSLELEKGENGAYQWKTGIAGQYTIFEPKRVEIVEDVYSPIREIKPDIQNIFLPAILEEKYELQDAKTQFNSVGADVAEKWFLPEHPRCYTENGNTTVEENGTFHMLLMDGEGRMESQQNHWESVLSDKSSGNTKKELGIVSYSIPQEEWVGGDVQISSQISLIVRTISSVALPMVVGLEMELSKKPDPNRPDLILRRVGEEGLWQLAKENGSSVEKIREVNQLEEEPHSGKMLLIPVI